MAVAPTRSSRFTESTSNLYVAISASSSIAPSVPNQAFSAFTVRRSELTDVVTVPFKVIQQMLKHPLTDTGLAQFVADYKKAFGG